MKKIWFFVILVLLLQPLALIGCEKEEYILSSDGDVTCETMPDGEREGNAQTASDGTRTADVASGNAASAEQSGETVNSAGGNAQSLQTIYVHVCGAVLSPGVYELPVGARLCDAVESAGGFETGASEDALNLASVLTDGQQVYVPTKAEILAGWEGGAAGVIPGQEDDGLVNINTAEVEELCSLPGIGESRAEAIIAYRQEHGGFGTVEEIMQVTGIKEGMFAKIKDMIRV
ncbi:MAG: helix-hairpin-helix domain-containing protein [Lachnospiraceae bacterium]|nr:helix-hairpin-helix domain-containing protein [Lachnospiraceae bacterium]